MSGEEFNETAPQDRYGKELYEMSGEELYEFLRNTFTTDKERKDFLYNKMGPKEHEKYRKYIYQNDKQEKVPNWYDGNGPEILRMDEKILQQKERSGKELYDKVITLKTDPQKKREFLQSLNLAELKRWEDYTWENFNRMEREENAAQERLELERFNIKILDIKNASGKELNNIYELIQTEEAKKIFRGRLHKDKKAFERWDAYRFNNPSFDIKRFDNPSFNEPSPLSAGGRRNKKRSTRCKKRRGKRTRNYKTKR